MSDKKGDVQKEETTKKVAGTAAVVDPAYTSYLEALGKAQSEFDAASTIGDKKLISNAAQKVYDIKEMERVRVANLSGYSERLVDENPQAD
ncbi:MAG TPA: hypothetical protein VIM07_00830 [Chitinophagaceae bacterium]